MCTFYFQRRFSLKEFVCRFIHSVNRAGLTYKLAANHLADQTEHEVRMLRGKLRSSGPNRGQPFHYTANDLEKIPDQMDWRLYGAVSSVKGTILLLWNIEIYDVTIFFIIMFFYRSSSLWLMLEFWHSWYLGGVPFLKNWQTHSSFTTGELVC